MTRPGVAKFQGRVPRVLWDQVDACTLKAGDMVVWSTGHSTWPWQARKGEVVLQMNGRDRRFASSDAAMAAAERQWRQPR